MIGRKSIVGLSLLCALALCAFAASSASAAWQTATNTTAYTCGRVGVGDFEDAHCDRRVTAGTGSYGHELIPVGETTEVEFSNTKTKNNTTEAEPTVLTGTAFGVALTITCKKTEPDTSLTSWLKNVGSGTTHDVEGTIAVDFTECTVSLANCTVTEPITVAALVHGVEEPAKGAMALEFEPDPTVSTHFFVLKFSGTKCVFNGQSLNFDGSFKATGNTTEPATGRYTGATSVLEGGNEMSSLTFAGNAATLTGKFTTKMAGETGNPISLTTVT